MTEKTAQPSADARDRDERRRRDLKVVVMASIALAVTVVLATNTTDPVPTVDDWGWIGFLGIALMCGASEIFTFKFPVGRNSIVAAVAEIPIALAIVFLDPLAAPLTRLPFALLYIALWRSDKLVSLYLNGCMFMFEVAIAAFMLSYLVDWWGTSNVAIVFATSIAVYISTMATSLPITAATLLRDPSRPWRELVFRRWIEFAGQIWKIFAFNAALAGAILGFVLIEPWLVVFVIVLLVGIWSLSVANGRVSQEFRAASELLGLAGRLSTSTSAEAACQVAVEEAANTSLSIGAVLIRLTDDDDVVVMTQGDIDGRDVDASKIAAWHGLLDGRNAVIATPDRLESLGIRAQAPTTQLLITPVLGDDGILAILGIARFRRPLDRFNEHDHQRLINMAEQLSNGLRRTILHEQLEWEAHHDSLTGLPRRAPFERAVQDAMERPTDDCVAVVLLDLDRFKEVNDTLGHHSGDAVLQAFSRRIRRLVHPDDVLARLAGDEFAVLCRRPTTSEISEFARACAIACATPYQLDDLSLVVAVSIGVTSLASDDFDAAQPMRRADIAMYTAKRHRTGIEDYRSDLDDATPARLSMLGDLRSAIDNDELSLVYQPKVRLSDQQIVGVEALARWNHPVRGAVPPAEFIAVAEDTGLIRQLTDRVLARGIRHLAARTAAGHDLTLAINVSAHDLLDGNLVARVESHLASHAVEPERLTLEITESSLFVDAPRAQSTIAGLHAIGVRLSIDDFGTGYSSLSYLRNLPVHELKIDRSFVSRVLTDHHDEVIVKSTIDLGHNLDLVVVAEGVESQEVLERLQLAGCDIVQGYHVARPLTPGALTDWLSERQPSLGRTD